MRRSIIILCLLILPTGLWTVVYRFLEPPFFTTQSPDSIYTVNLFGQKERPLWFTVEVDMEVLKDGQPFKSRETIHAGDAMDLSFEAGYPDYRWIANAALQIYDREEFNSGKSREIVLVNDSSQVIKHLKIYSVDKFFLFDFEPGKEMHLSALPPKGDFAFVWLEGEFHSGDRFSSSAATMLQVGQSVPVFRIFVSDHGVRIEH